MKPSDPRTSPNIGPSIKSIIVINFTLLHASVLGGVAWLMWPETKECWRFGILSIILGAAAISFGVKAIGDIWRHIIRDKEIIDFKHGNRAPQSDKIAGDDAMDDGGMFL